MQIPISTPKPDIITDATGAKAISAVESIQSLWSGYGEILRIHLQGGSYRSVILKHIKLPQLAEHPRGWNTNLSHQRKLHSYQVESHWYQHYAHRCQQQCPIPQLLSVHESEDETFLLITDLADAGFTKIKDTANQQDIKACLSWLAHFHATFMQQPAKGLWPCGSYWHLDTRPDELAALDDETLRKSAPVIDQALKQCQFQTLIHGDAKLANFCFTPTEERVIQNPPATPTTNNTSRSLVAAVDFQYVGAGCGMKDVAYFLGSCLSDEECERLEKPLLDYYFQALINAVNAQSPKINTEQLEAEWRSMFDVAWADFHRFLKGWSPGHWKLTSYSERLTQRAIQRLNKQG